MENNKFIEKLIYENYNYLLIILSIFVIITDYSIKIYLAIILIIILLLVNYIKLEKNPDKYNNDDNIEKIVKEIKKYKKYNIIEYNRGKKKLLNILKILKHHDKYKHRNYQYDNIKFNISECLRHFNSMLLSIPTNKYIDTINYNVLKNNYQDFSNICKKLHEYLYQQLYNFGKKTNNSITYNSNMISNDIVESSNFYDDRNIY